MSVNRLKRDFLDDFPNRRRQRINGKTIRLSDGLTKKSIRTTRESRIIKEFLQLFKEV